MNGEVKRDFRGLTWSAYSVLWLLVNNNYLLLDGAFRVPGRHLFCTPHQFASQSRPPFPTKALILNKREGKVFV